MSKFHYEYVSATEKADCIREYRNVFSVREGELVLERLARLRRLQNANILVPDVSLSGAAVRLHYGGAGQYPPLFNSFFERKLPGGRKVRGDFNAFLGGRQRLEAALRLCGAFRALNDTDVYLRYPSDDMLTFDCRSGSIYLDAVPCVLPRTAAAAERVREQNVAYYLPLQDTRRKGFFGKDPSFRGKARNNIVLSLLLFKLFTGQDWVAWRKYSEYTGKKPDWEALVPETDELLFGKKFRAELCALLRGGKFAPCLLLRHPSEWERELESVLRCTCGGCFRKANEKLVCSDCGKERIGTVTMSGQFSLPLLVPNADYRMSMFEPGAGDDFLFKVHERENGAATERAVFFAAEQEAYELADERRRIDQYNSKGNYLQLGLDGKESCAVETNNRIFEFRIFPKAE